MNRCDELLSTDEAEDFKTLVKRFKDSDYNDNKAAGAMKKELKKVHSDIVKSFDKNLKEFMAGELKRIKKENPEHSITLPKIGKRRFKDVSGNSDSQFGDWYSSDEYRLVLTPKL